MPILAKAVVDNTIQNHLLEPEEERKRDIDEYNKKITPKKLEFFETDPKTQELLKIYSDVTNKGRGDFESIKKLMALTSKDPLLSLYILVKTDEMYQNENKETK